MASPDDAIDNLYRLPLSEFTAARNALAKTLTGADKARVQALTKPTLVPWAVNQVYWAARPTYDRVMKTGAALRTAQLDALEGRHGKIAKAQDAHRDALRDATTRALAAGAKAGVQPPAEPVSRMLEAISLSASPPEHPGRLTEIVQPSGFEALAGIAPERIVAAAIQAKPLAAETPVRHAPSAKELAQQRARAEAAVRSAEQAVSRATDREAAAEQTLDVLRQRTADAETARAAAHDAVAESAARLRAAQAELAALEPVKPSRTRPSGRV